MASERAVSRPTGGSRVERWAEHRAAVLLLVFFALLEATVFPAPTEALFVALLLVRKRSHRRAAALVALATLASVAGGLIGYGVGAALFDEVGRPLLAWSGAEAHFVRVGAFYRQNLFVALATSGYTPIPYLVYTTAGGAFQVPLPTFVAGSLVGRGLKYLVLGAVGYGLAAPLRALLARLRGRHPAVPR